MVHDIRGDSVSLPMRSVEMHNQYQHHRIIHDNVKRSWNLPKSTSMICSARSFSLLINSFARASSCAWSRPRLRVPAIGWVITFPCSTLTKHSGDAPTYQKIMCSTERYICATSSDYLICIDAIQTAAAGTAEMPTRLRVHQQLYLNYLCQFSSVDNIYHFEWAQVHIKHVRARVKHTQLAVNIKGMNISEWASQSMRGNSLDDVS